MEVLRYSPDQISKLPKEPGVYKYYDKNGLLLYVGKAKNLKKRVSSYFLKTRQFNRKTLRLVSEIRAIEITISHSEFDALLLENNLIKENQPKYNILLKDDKTFPYICIVKERFPRIISTRKYNPDKGEFYGPYSSVVAMNSVLELIGKLYTIRTCKYNLSEENIKAGKFNVCLEYHIKNCQGPCEGLQSEENYMNDIDLARHILKTNTSVVKNIFHTKMKQHAEDYEYELAQQYKSKIDLLQKYQSRTMVVNTRTRDTDVFTILSDEHHAYINYLRIKNGAITFTQTVEVKKKLDEADSEILGQMAYRLRSNVQSESKELLTNVKIQHLGEEIKCIVPKIGDKKKLLEMSLKNAFIYKKEKQLTKETLRQRNNESVRALQNDLKLLASPNHIECFDNSNIQGSNPVSAMVCFKRGKPAKKDYRNYHIKTVDGPDDFASMYEVVSRRYSRLKKENKPYPNLILIDGGKGQLSSSVKALKDIGLYGQIPIIGIAKRLEEIYVPGDQLPLHISKKSPSLKLLQQLRDEAHRFAITFHRKTRSKNSFTTELENIKGVGQNTIDKLLSHFKSVNKIRQSDEQKIAKVVGISKASIIINHLHKKES